MLQQNQLKFNNNLYKPRDGLGMVNPYYVIWKSIDNYKYLVYYITYKKYIILQWNSLL